MCDVEWAVEFVKRDIQDKINLAASNIASSHRDHSEALLRKIVGMLDKDTYEKTGVICNRLRKYAKEDVKKALEKLMQDGVIEKKTDVTGKNRRFDAWRLIK